MRRSFRVPALLGLIAVLPQIPALAQQPAPVGSWKLVDVIVRDSPLAGGTINLDASHMLVRYGRPHGQGFTGDLSFTTPPDRLTPGQSVNLTATGSCSPVYEAQYIDVEADWVAGTIVAASEDRRTWGWTEGAFSPRNGPGQRAVYGCSGTPSNAGNRTLHVPATVSTAPNTTTYLWLQMLSHNYGAVTWLYEGQTSSIPGGAVAGASAELCQQRKDMEADLLKQAQQLEADAVGFENAAASLRPELDKTNRRIEAAKALKTLKANGSSWDAVLAAFNLLQDYHALQDTQEEIDSFQKAASQLRARANTIRSELFLSRDIGAAVGCT